ncbi:hypothetical protein TKK_0007519 [Trichogramma kaykai]
MDRRRRRCSPVLASCYSYNPIVHTFQAAAIVLLSLSFLGSRGGLAESSSSSHRAALPAHLRECYTRHDGVLAPSLPLNLPVVLDIVRKLESSSSSSLRDMSNGILGRFKLDGIEHVRSHQITGVAAADRYQARGPQRLRNRVLQELLPREALPQAEQLLTRAERCLLHQALSNSLWSSRGPGEERFCEPAPPRGRLAATCISVSFALSCPFESGVVLTHYGTVALGSVVAAVAAALQPQQVRARLLQDLPGLAATRPAAGGSSDRQRAAWRRDGKSSQSRVDNVWLATLAGDLAEMVVNQGPATREQMYLGASGFWNSTIRPRAFYVRHRYDSWDATRAELLGDVDGLILARHMEQWPAQVADGLRLSQLLDMYYSEKGVVAVTGGGLDNGASSSSRVASACRRSQDFAWAAPNSLIEEQTYAAAQVIGYLGAGAAPVSEEALQRLSTRAVVTFDRYANQGLLGAQPCLGQRRDRPRLELLVAFDGAFTPEYTAEFLASLIDDFDVSAYGSRMGLLDGETGRWLTNVTASTSDAHQALNRLSRINWPDTVDFPAVLGSIEAYLDKNWQDKSGASHAAGSVATAVVLLVPQVHLNERQLTQALESVKRLKSKHPDTQFLYYTCESKYDQFRRFLLTDEDHVVKSLVASDISRHLSSVPKTLRPTSCSSEVPSEKSYFEDYIDPDETNTYRLHPHWRYRTKRLTLSVQGVGYGLMKVCWWNQWTSSSPRMSHRCDDLSLYTDLTLADEANLCDENEDKKCPITYVQVTNVSSTVKCVEKQCRYPDQVRYRVRVETDECSSGARNASVLKLTLTLLLLVSLIQ